MVAQSDQPVAPAAADLRVLLLELARNGLQISIRLSERHAGPQTRNHLVVIPRALLERKSFWVELQWHPQIRGEGHVESSRQNPNHRIITIPQQKRLADVLGRARKETLCKLVTDQRDWRAAGSISVRA